MLLINNREVEQLFDMKACLEALETGYDDLLKGDAVYRPRIDVWVPCERPDGYYRWGTMEGASRKIGVFAIRMKSDVVHWPNGETEEKYCIAPGTYCGLVLVFSVRNGEPLAIINDGLLQHMRVGGCAGLGAKVLARQDASVAAIFGSGGMARTYLEAFCEVRKVKQARVFSPTRAHREAYAKEMTGKLDIEVIAVDDPEKAVRGADIIATCTDSTRTVFDNPEWLKEGAHITCVRACEVGPRVVRRCDVSVKLGKNTVENLEEGMVRLHGNAGYIAGQPEERSRIPNPPVDNYRGDYFHYFMDVKAGRAPGRDNDKQITFFINAGTQGLQFAACAGRIYQLARQKGIGRELPAEWFLQDIRD
ncbi:MAG TPA: ornithine cyclodeaminase family protein [Candidatus Eisenbacteria bacterium]|nr:ornithine cyclodeaminase family protein [Candidatus Eisenbacteria bacterium]